MACIAGRHDAVKEINASCHPLDDIAGCSYSHQVSWLVLRHIRLNLLDDLIHHLSRFSHRQAANSIPIAIQLCNFLHVPNTQIRECSALIDAKKHLPRIHCVRQCIQAVVLPLAAFQPPERPLTAVFGIGIGRRIFHAFIKSHRNIRAKIRLDLHAFLRPHKNPVPIQMRCKGHTLLPYFPQTGERKNLKATGIRQNRPIPAHEPMQAAQRTDYLITGAQMQMVGIGQLDLTAYFFQVEGAEPSLDSPLRTYIHKNRRLYLAAMGTPETAASGATLPLDYFKHIR